MIVYGKFLYKYRTVCLRLNTDRSTCFKNIVRTQIKSRDNYNCKMIFVRKTWSFTLIVWLLVMFCQAILGNPTVYPKRDNRCHYTSQDETIVVECNTGQSCYAIVSVQHVNETWQTHEYSLGCWDMLPYCSENFCAIDLPNYVSIERNFPRFCCCKGDLCNRNIKLD